MEAIQTYFKGHHFRSRLEARWAVFFEMCGADWEYEPEGFDLGGGLKYLPDFKLRHVNGSHFDNQTLWVEVKGDMDEESAQKILHFSEPIYVVGPMPHADDLWELTRKMGAMAYDGPAPHYYNFETVIYDHFAAYPGVFKGYGEEGTGKGFGLFGDDSNYLCMRDDGLTWRAFQVALSARFEHGETPMACAV